MSFFTTLVTSKIAAAALAAGTLAVGGTAAAAYTGTLPTPLQQSAHNILGAPAPVPSTTLAASTATTTTEAAATTEATEKATAGATEEATATESPLALPAGPDATGPAAYGLCQSFAHGGLDTSSTAYKSLAIAASGTTNIATYCAAVPSPGKSASHRPAETGTGTAAATAHKPAVPQQAATGTAHKPAVPQQAATGTAHKPAVPQQAATGTAHIPAVPQQAATGTAHIPAVPQQAATGTAHKPVTGRR
ncbi:protein tyrosine phosphatase [Arthrobacter sp. A2-55]|uniref:protein tyrosine phosphatase n=1 Tax=Arthrobacter sp. A2-55 TaxID=2897337 RepID=UPI0021CDA304|nr:protein tyrosine phosphatase [Arthrobacter sp. A2-55]